MFTAITLNKYTVNGTVLRLYWASAITMAAMACLWSMQAHAQDQDVIYSYEQPSDEMDFDIPPLPTLDNAAPPPPPMAADPMAEVDRFFSDAPVLDIEEPDPIEDITEDAAEKEDDAEKKKVVRRFPAKPPYNFKSVVLPHTIYKKQYRTDNRHLPVARYKSDMELGVAGSAGRAEIGSMRALKNMGTPVNIRANNGEPVLAIAARLGNVNTVHWLLIQGADVNQMSAEGLTALHYAAFRASPPMVELLLSYGADPNLPDTRGVTPLMYAARGGSLEAAKQLLAFGASPHALTPNSENAMHMAARSNNVQMIRLLESAGTTSSQANAQGFTPRYFAARNTRR